MRSIQSNEKECICQISQHDAHYYVIISHNTSVPMIGHLELATGTLTSHASTVRSYNICQVMQYMSGHAIYVRLCSPLWPTNHTWNYVRSCNICQVMTYTPCPEKRSHSILGRFLNHTDGQIDGRDKQMNEWMKEWRTAFLSSNQQHQSTSGSVV